MPDAKAKRYNIGHPLRGERTRELAAAEIGTVGREGKYGEAYLIHQVDGVAYKTKISTLRGDYQKPDGTLDNRLRLWEKFDFMPRDDDLLKERLYCIQWTRPREQGTGEEYQFRPVTEDDIRREQVSGICWPASCGLAGLRAGFTNMQIRVGGPPRYQGLDLIRARGWTHWHHLFNPRQLLVAGLVNQFSNAKLVFGLMQTRKLGISRLCRWNIASGGGGRCAGHVLQPSTEHSLQLRLQRL